MKGFDLDVVKSEHDLEREQPIRGIRVRAKFIGVGVNTAQKLKNEGIISFLKKW
ncbi:MAG: hypothetical protein IPH84_12585 [Bacteroidales bacterium]|nr:hypothetical protein [Bacteroidales bacterium]